MTEGQFQPRPLLVVALCGIGLALLTAGVTGQYSPPTIEDSHDHSDTDSGNVTLEFESGVLESGPEQRIRGETDQQLEVFTLRLTTLDGPTLESEQPAVVGRSGTFETAINLSTLQPGTAVELTVEDETDVLARTETTVRECQRACQNPSDRPSLQLADDLTLEAGPAQRIGGETSIGPGTWLQGEIRQGENRVPIDFITTFEGQFVTETDLSELTPDEPATVSVRWADNGLATESRQTVTIVDEGSPPHGDGETASGGQSTDGGHSPTTGDKQTGEGGSTAPIEDEPAAVAETVDSGEIVQQFDEPLTYGETAQIPVDMADLDEAVIEVYGTTGLEATLELEDKTGTDRVTVAFDSHPSGTDPLFFAADPGDRVELAELDGAVSPGPVTVELYSEGQLIDTAQLDLLEPSDSSGVNQNTAPDGESESTDWPLVPIGLFTLATLCAGAGIALLAGWVEQ